MIERSRTLEDWMNSPEGRKNGFDAIRLIAACVVIFSHSFPITRGSNDTEPVYWLTSGQSTMGGLAVGVFFVISGVFISASFENTSSRLQFAVKRARRIIPALFVSVVFLTFLVGPFLSTLPLREYIQSKQIWNFLGNITFLPSNYGLPGVFIDRPEQAINGSLWSLKFEVLCYVVCAFLLYLRFYPQVFVSFLWVTSFLVARNLSDGSQAVGLYYYLTIASSVFRYFGAGMLIYLYRSHIRLNRSAALFSVFLTTASIGTPFFIEVSSVFGAYAVMTLGYHAPIWLRSMTRRGDFSYGVYIYGWPVQQMVWPIGAASSAHWLINSALAIPLAIILGALSWFLIEKPALKFRLQARQVVRSLRSS